MLPIAEDLGVIPPGVRETLAELGICSTKVIPWERHWDTDQSYIPLSAYSPLSTCCLSTHDSQTLALWWENAPEEAKLFAHSLGLPYKSPLSPHERKQILSACHNSSSLFHIDLLQEYLALFPELVHPTLEQERINVPGTVSPTNWAYRLVPSLEQLKAHRALKKTLSDILQSEK